METEGVVVVFEASCCVGEIGVLELVDKGDVEGETGMTEMGRLGKRGGR